MPSTVSRRSNPMLETMKTSATLKMAGSRDGK